MNSREVLSRLPQVNQVLQEPSMAAMLEEHPRAIVVDEVREALRRLRADLLGDPTRAPSDRDALTAALLEAVSRSVEARSRLRFQRVINATGVVLHTNLGRSLLCESARRAADLAGAHYGNLELDLSSGRRGSRYSAIDELLTRLTGAEASLVVNNNAAAVLLALGTLAAGREVIISRGQLVEIGGSFRIPEVMEQSGARLVEVGATNKTRLRDYREAITDQTALLLHVHTSNYRIVGFTHETALEDLVALGRERDIPVVSDLGSGVLVDLSRYGYPNEPTVIQTIAAGVDVVTFSGDKLMGGPQAGLIAGRQDLVERMKTNPLTRALRVDKMTLAALEATLWEYLEPDAVMERIPTLRMLATDERALEERAEQMARMAQMAIGDRARIQVEAGESQVGGGALPTARPVTFLVTIEPATITAAELAARLRAHEPAVIGRVRNERLCLDPRTISDGELPEIRDALARSLERKR